MKGRVQSGAQIAPAGQRLDSEFNWVKMRSELLPLFFFAWHMGRVKQARASELRVYVRHVCFAILGSACFFFSDSDFDSCVLC